MGLVEAHTSPDGRLRLEVHRGADGRLAVGFAGEGAWHTHSDVLAAWLSVPEQEAVQAFIQRLLHDDLPIVMSTDSGETVEPWVSDDLSATLQYFGVDRCRLRYWSGREVLRDEL
jgi:hypothetical protein